MVSCTRPRTGKRTMSSPSSAFVWTMKKKEYAYLFVVHNSGFYYSRSLLTRTKETNTITLTFSMTIGPMYSYPWDLTSQGTQATQHCQVSRRTQKHQRTESIKQRTERSHIYHIVYKTMRCLDGMGCVLLLFVLLRSYTSGQRLVIRDRLTHTPPPFFFCILIFFSSVNFCMIDCTMYCIQKRSSPWSLSSSILTWKSSSTHTVATLTYWR